MVGNISTFYLHCTITHAVNVFVVILVIIAGYDLQQVNLYISKLFDNIGCLVYSEVNDEDLKFNFTITSVQSHMGENLPLKQVRRLCIILFVNKYMKTTILSMYYLKSWM